MIAIFSDFDNTLCPHSDPSTFKRNLAAVKKFRRHGHKFILTTGRSLPSLRRKLPNYADYFDYLLLNNGSICLNVKTHEVLFTIPFRPRLVDQLVDFTRVLDVDDEFGFVFYSAGEEETPHILGEVTKLTIWTVTDEATDEFLEAIHYNFGALVNAFPVYGTYPKDGQYWINPYNHALIEIVAGESGKENGVAKFIKQVEKPDRAITIGDGPNDVAMLTNFEGYAPATADSEVLAAVPPEHVVASVGTLIEKLL